jgi:hypothetical protein
MTEGQSQLPLWMAGFLPVFLVLFWLFITSMLGLFASWFQLQRQFPRNDDRPLLRLRMRSGSMGMVSIGGVLSLSACQSGLRVGILRLFGPFQHPFQVPWNEIEAELSQRLFIPVVKLRFGRPQAGSLVIDAGIWERLKAAGTGVPTPIVATGRLARAYYSQWAAITLFAGCFFSFGPRLLAPTAAAPPPLICFGLPAFVVGVSQSIRFLRAL